MNDDKKSAVAATPTAQVNEPVTGKLIQDAEMVKLDSIFVSTVRNAKDVTTTDGNVAAILMEIKDGKWKAQVGRIRQVYAEAEAGGRDPKKAVAELKKQLQGILWSGRFSKRANSALLEHSGILCADLDHIKDRIPGVREKLKSSPHVLAILISPTLTGLKVLFRVPADASRHSASFTAVKKHVLEWTGCEIDESCKDVARLCFVSYDPELWENPDAIEIPVVEGDQEKYFEEDSKELEQRFGAPYYTTDKGAVTSINESYWAGLYSVENTILYEPDEKHFYSFNEANGIFEIESEDAIRTKLSLRILMASRQIKVCGLEKKRTTAILDNVIAQLRGIVEKRGAFAHQQKWIHLANGVLVFNGSDFDLRPFSPEYLSRNCSPISFDETATCDRFLNELVRPAVHEEDVELLQKFMGMCLLGSNRAQRFLILDGESGRGKTQFANVLQGLIGMANVTQLRTKHLAERFELYRFRKKTLLVGVDVDAEFLSTKGAAVLKGLVGGDYFDAEMKGGTRSFPLQGKFNAVITSNTRLRVRLQGDLSAWKRRLTIVRYEAPPPAKKIPDFAEQLIKIEGSGILNWALLGAAMVLTEMPDEGGDLTLTPRQLNIVDSLLAESDSLRHFLKDRVILDPHLELSVGDILEAYAAYCPERGWRAFSIIEVQNQLEVLMLELFNKAKRHDIERGCKEVRGFSGVTLKQS